MPEPAADPLPFDLTRAAEVAAEIVEAARLPCLVFGVADGAGRSEIVAISGTQEVHADSVIFIASVTKAIVATAVMQYVDEGRLDLESPLARYMPEIRGSGLDGVTSWHLLTHTSGLPDISAERIRRERPTYQRMLKLALADSPRWLPGTRYEYNSSAWVLLSELMSRLSTTPFPEVLRQRLLDPLDMGDTVFDARGLRARLISVDGAGASNRLAREILLWMLARATFPGGGMFGTVPDLLRLGSALLPSAGTDLTQPRILSAKTVADMAEDQTLGLPAIDEDGIEAEMRQGLGWRKSAGGWPPGDRVITHGGRTGGRLWVDPEHDLAFAFLTNVWGTPSDAVIKVLRAVYAAKRST